MTALAATPWPALLASVSAVAAAAYLVHTVVRFARADADLTLLSRRQPPPGAFRGKVVWVVGASQGLGEALALYWAQQGARLVLSSRSLDKLGGVKQQCLAYLGQGDVALVRLDLAGSAAEVDAAAEAAFEAFGALDYVVHNAGRCTCAWGRGPISVARATLPYMLRQGRGQHVVVASMSAVVPSPGQAVYAAAKSGLRSYFSSLASEMAERGVGVTLCCPGPLATGTEARPRVVYGASGLITQAATGLSKRRVGAGRAAQLIATAAYHKLDECWIAFHPVLLMGYLMQYMPWLGMRVLKRVGARRAATLKSGGSGYDVAAMFRGAGSAAVAAPSERVEGPTTSRTSYWHERCTILLSDDDASISSLNCELRGRKWKVESLLDSVFMDPDRQLCLRRVRADAAAILQLSLVNQLCPLAWLSGAEAMARLATRCYAAGEVLVAASATTREEVVFLPRPAAHQDGHAFVAFLTSMAAVDYCAGLVRDRKVGIVFDLDDTLISSTAVTHAEMASRRFLNWKSCALDVSVGPPGTEPELITLQHAEDWLPSPDLGGRCCDGAHVAYSNDPHRGFPSYRIVARKGWSELRTFLVEHRDQFQVGVLSLAHTTYVKACWQLLDFDHALIAAGSLSSCCNSARDVRPAPGLAALPSTGHAKSHALAAGVPPPLRDLRLFPLLVFDDRIDVWSAYADTVVQVPPLSASRDEGWILRGARDLSAWQWVVTYGEDGGGGAAADLARAAVATLHTLQTLPDPDLRLEGLVECQIQAIGSQLWAAFTQVAAATRGGAGASAGACARSPRWRWDVPYAEM
eukprot:scaffold4.g4887.t1